MMHLYRDHLTNKTRDALIIAALLAACVVALFGYGCEAWHYLNHPIGG